VITIGKTHAYKQNNCSDNHDECPAALTESFDNFGSWLVSFGIGALGVTLILLAIVTCYRMAFGKGAPGSAERRMPSLNWKVLRFAGVGAGSCWALANFLITAAVVIGSSLFSIAFGFFIRVE
jgi:hypothetical protein